MFRAPCAHHQVVKIVLYSMWYHHTYRWPSHAQVERGLLSQPMHVTATYRCDDTRGCIIQFWPPDDEHICSNHVEAWNKLIAKQIFCASSWLITEIKRLFKTNILILIATMPSTCFQTEGSSSGRRVYGHVCYKFDVCVTVQACGVLWFLNMFVCAYNHQYRCIKHQNIPQTNMFKNHRTPHACRNTLTHRHTRHII